MKKEIFRLLNTIIIGVTIYEYLTGNIAKIITNRQQIKMTKMQLDINQQIIDSKKTEA